MGILYFIWQPNFNGHLNMRTSFLLLLRLAPYWNTTVCYPGGHPRRMLRGDFLGGFEVNSVELTRGLAGMGQTRNHRTRPVCVTTAFLAIGFYCLMARGCSVLFLFHFVVFSTPFCLCVSVCLVSIDLSSSSWFFPWLCWGYGWVRHCLSAVTL